MTRSSQYGIVIVIPFDFVEPASLQEALGLLDPGDPAVRPLAGGTALMLLMKSGFFRPKRLISLRAAGDRLTRIAPEADGAVLMRHAGQSVTRTMLLERVWEYHFDPQTNVIDVHISRLRSKIDKGFDRPMLLTVRGAGYRLEA